MTAAYNNYTPSTRSVAQETGVASGWIGWAGVVAEHAPDLVPLVIAGVRPLKDAYDKARESRDAAATDTDRMEVKGSFHLPPRLDTSTELGRFA